MSSRLTRLRRRGPGTVELEVDGRPWRVVPDDVVLRCRLVAGVELDRPLLRRLRAELRAADALRVAGRALGRRDLSRARLSERLRRAGVAPAFERATLGTLDASALVDDARFARARARALVEAGWGDEAIRVRLEREGLGREEREAALAEVAPEVERARPVVAAAADARRAAQLLARRGFAEETIEAAFEGFASEEP